MTIVCNGGNIRPTGENLIVPTEIPRMQNIQNEIKLAARELTSLPDCVRQNVQLKILDLSHNFLGRTGDGALCELSELRNLTRLNLSVNELKTISLDFCSFPFLEVLCLSGNELEYLSEGIVTLHRLRRLLCDFNHMKCLPLDWSMLISLTTLSLSNNHLEEIPTTIWTLQNLEILNLQRNRISTIGPLPEGAACRLKELRLAENRLSGSLDLSLLVNLTYLDVSHNDLEDIEVSKLSKLEYLVVSQNVLKSLNLDGAKLRSLEADENDLEVVFCKQLPLNLESLNLSHNAFSSLPDWIVEAKSLSFFSIHHNRILSISKELFSNCDLQVLKLNHNLLTEIPEFFAKCHIKSLCLQYNKIEKLPENFFKIFPSLQELNLCYNCLHSFPQPCCSSSNLRTLLLSGNQLNDVTNIANFLSGSEIESLHLAYNGIKELPDDFVINLPALDTFSCSGNDMTNISSQIAKAPKLKKLYLHSNLIANIPKLSDSPNLKILDLACNKLQQLELASIVPKGLTYLDLSANSDLQIDPTDFQHLCYIKDITRKLTNPVSKSGSFMASIQNAVVTLDINLVQQELQELQSNCQRSVAVVDVNCAGRQAPLSDSALKETENLSPWILGFTESQDGNTRLYIEFQKDAVSGRQEALIALMEVEDPEEVSQLRSVLPDLLKAERENKETYPHFLKKALLSCVRFLRSRNYVNHFGITMCHLSSTSGCPVTLRLGTIGRPSSCILGRAGNIIVLAQRQEVTPFGIDEWNQAMQETEVCCNNYFNSAPSKPVPKGLWTCVPDPEVRELVLSPQDKFLVFGDNAFSRIVPADEVCRQVQGTTSPVAASKALSEMYSALTSGKRECIAVIMLKFDALPIEEDVEKYRCWEFMLEQNHKLLFTKELETINKTILHNGDQRPNNVDPSSWYTTALSKYKCPLPSHRGRYYCYGNKLE